MSEIDSNSTSLSFAEQQGFNDLGVAPVWYGVEVNSYSDFGSKATSIARSPIEQGRQDKKGGVVRLDASGGFNADLTQTNLTRLQQGFFYADIIQLPTTEPMNGAKIAITSVTASTKRIAAASGMGVFAAGQLAYVSGSAIAANNGIKTVAASAAGYVETVEALVDEVSPPAAMKVEVVGWQFASGDVNVTMSGNLLQLSSTATNFSTIPLKVGGWVFIGGDPTQTRFANNVGYARVKTIASTLLTLDDATFTGVAEAGTGKTIRLFFGNIIKNQKDPLLQKRRFYNLERTLGMGPNGTQAQYLENALANDWTMKIADGDKITIDMGFIATNEITKTGGVGDEIKTGTRISAPGEDLFNTSSNVYRLKAQLKSSSNSNAPPLFAYFKEATINIKNGVTPRTAIGSKKAIGMNIGNFKVSSTMTAYFEVVDALNAIPNNSDAEFNVILAARNCGQIYDIPLMSVGGGQLSVNKDDSITVPLENNAAENENGYTMLHQVFPYLPTIAMPV